MRSEHAVELKVDRAVYLVDESTRSYRYLRRNAEWRGLDPGENERNKRHLVGYMRIFPDGRTKRFTYRAPYTTKAQSAARGANEGQAPRSSRKELRRADRKPGEWRRRRASGRRQPSSWPTRGSR